MGVSRTLITIVHTLRHTVQIHILVLVLEYRRMRLLGHRLHRLLIQAINILMLTHKVILHHSLRWNELMGLLLRLHRLKHYVVVYRVDVAQINHRWLHLHLLIHNHLLRDLYVLLPVDTHELINLLLHLRTRLKLKP